MSSYFQEINSHRWLWGRDFFRSHCWLVFQDHGIQSAGLMSYISTVTWISIYEIMILKNTFCQYSLMFSLAGVIPFVSWLHQVLWFFFTYHAILCKFRKIEYTPTLLHYHSCQEPWRTSKQLCVSTLFFNSIHQSLFHSCRCREKMLIINVIKFLDPL